MEIFTKERVAKINKIIFIVICCILPISYLYGVVNKYLFQNYGVYTTGVIVKESGTNIARIVFHYEFYVEGKKYENTSAYSNLRNNAREALVGKSFPVVYYSKGPGKNVILITPNDFEYLNKPFPDSLNRVLEYVRD